MAIKPLPQNNNTHQHNPNNIGYCTRVDQQQASAQGQDRLQEIQFACPEPLQDHADPNHSNDRGDDDLKYLVLLGIQHQHLLIKHEQKGHKEGRDCQLGSLQSCL